MHTRFVFGISFGFILACAGLVGFGNEQARHTVVSGQPFQLTYTPATSDPHNLWFELELDSGYRVDGTLNIGGQPQQVQIFDGNAPMGGAHVTYMWTSVNGSANGYLRGTTLPGSTAGQPVTIDGTLTFAPGTKGTVELVVTD